MIGVAKEISVCMRLVPLCMRLCADGKAKLLRMILICMRLYASSVKKAHFQQII